MELDRSILWRAALIQLVAVALLSVALAAVLPHNFFDNWGWLVGPAAWMTCAALTARILRLPMWSALVGAALAGVPSAIAVVFGLHWLGAALAIAVFAVWCARLPRRGPAWT